MSAIEKGRTRDLPPHPERGSSTGTPRWVPVVVIVVGLLVLLGLVLLHLSGGLGPGLHGGN